MKTQETSWGEEIILEVVAISVEVSSICFFEEKASSLQHPNAGTFDSDVYMSIGVAGSGSLTNTLTLKKVKWLALFFPMFFLSVSKQLIDAWP